MLNSLRIPVAAVLLQLLCCTCFSAFSIAAEEPRFTGTLREITTPVTLRYKPVHHFRMEVLVDARFNGANNGTSRSSILLHGTITRADEILHWDQTMWVGVNTLNAKSAGEPIIVRMDSDARGEVSHIQLEGKDPFSHKTLEPGTPEYAKVSADILDNVHKLPAMALRDGDDFGDQSDAEALLKKFNLPPNTDADVKFSSIVKGLATINGFTCIVLQVSATIEVRAQGGQMTMTLGGYTALDTDTALPIDSHVIANIDVTGSQAQNLTMDIAIGTVFHE